MPNGLDEIVINDHFFLQALSCPLKIPFLIEDSGIFSSRPLYRQRNKLNMRNAVALQFSNLKFTSDDTHTAIAETSDWLQEKNVTICGAVMKAGNLQTRVPVLVKEGNTIRIIQVHGKLRKPNERKKIDTPGKSRTTTLYLLKAAYRKYVVQRMFPDAGFEIRFFFPNKNFRAERDGLNRFMLVHKNSGQPVDSELRNLFSVVEATKGTEIVENSLPPESVHSLYEGKTIAESIELIRDFTVHKPGNKFSRHKGCGPCDYRKDREAIPGCWSQNFGGKQVDKPDKHLFELMGTGNQAELEKGVFYQEEAEIGDGLHSLEKIQKYGGPVFSIQQRRNLQVMQARGERVPLVWVRRGLKVIDDLRWPLHFIDFEASTYAIPMRKGSPPYEPVFFQFSCHTLHQSGELRHHEWIDLNEERADPHDEFIRQFAGIPDIYDGTLVQFSPFEKQGINRLIRDFNAKYGTECPLETIRAGRQKGYEYRFFDLNDCVKKYYHNSFINEGLGLKQVLKSIIRLEKNNINDSDNSLPLLVPNGFEREQLEGAYQKIQTNGSGIMDGSAAMNAWIAYKNGLLNEEEEQTVPLVLKKYCALDTLALSVVFQHLSGYTELVSAEDFILFRDAKSN